MTRIFRKGEAIALVLLAFWVAYNLAVLLKTGFISDDAYNSQIKGQIIQQGVSLWARIFYEVEGWLMGSGRFMVLTWPMTYGLYYFTQDTVLVKSLTIAIITACILLFYVFSRRETGSWQLALLACLCLPAFVQFRFWHDPVLAFTFLMPVTLALSLAGLVMFQKYLDQGATWRCVAAAAFYLMALWMYEIAIPLCLLFAAVAYARTRSLKAAVVKSLPFTGLAFVMVVASAALRLYFIQNSAYAQSTYPGAELHVDPLKFLAAFAIQTFSTVPLSYWGFSTDQFSLVWRFNDVYVFGLFALGIAVLVYAIGRRQAPPRLFGWLLCAGLLLLLPSVLTSLSGHQGELITVGWGFGYIPVFMQYFGLCTFTVALVGVVATRLRWRLVLAVFALAVSAGVTTVAAFNLAHNRAVAFKSNETYKYPRDLLRAALKADIAKDMGEGAVLFRTMRYPSDYTWAYTGITGKTFTICEMAEEALARACVQKLGADQAGRNVIDVSGKDVWMLSYNFDRKGNRTGRVILGKISRIGINPRTGQTVQMLSGDIRVFDFASGQVSKLPLGGPVNFMRILETQAEDMADAQPMTSMLQPALDVDFDWSGKVHGREGTYENNLRWSSGSALLTLHNFSDRVQHVEVSLQLATPTVGNSSMTIRLPDRVETVAVSHVPKPYVARIALPPGEAEISFVSDAEPIRNGDPRNIVFGLFNFKLALLPAPAASSASAPTTPRALAR